MSYIAEQIRAVLEIDGTRPSVYFEDKVWTWGDLRVIKAALNEKLDALRLPPGAGVGCLLRNRPPHFGAILGVISAERCIVTFNPIMPDEKIAADIRKIRPPLVVGSADDWARPAVADAVRDIGAAGIILTDDRAHPVEWAPGLDRIGAGLHLSAAPEIAVLMLTSGTTGEPKRAPLSYRQLDLNMKRAARADRNWREDAPPTLKNDISLLFTPLVHIGGLYFVISGAIGGRQTRLLERFSVKEWLKAVKDLKLQNAGGPPAVLKMILDANIPKEEVSSLVALGSGTAALDPAIVDEFLRRYDLPVLATYGATEFAGAVAGWSLANFRKYWTEKRGAAGRMHPGIEARTVDPETGEPQPLNTSGILELRGPVIGDGKDWVRTSDLARLDADHFLWILGRADNAIIRGGFKVHPEEVVTAIEQHPAIREASVVGISDVRLGHVPVAAYISNEGAAVPSDAELSAFLRERLAPYQIPVAFRRVDELPRTPSLKVSMPGVRALFKEEAAR